jgi:hypothetical protein
MSATPEIIAGVLSVAGAFLFFGVGFFLAKLKTVSVPVQNDAMDSSILVQHASGPDAESESSAVAPDTRPRSEILLEIEQLRQTTEHQKEENRTIYAAAKSRMVKLKKMADKATSEAEELKLRLNEAKRTLSAAIEEKDSLSRALQRSREDLTRKAESSGEFSGVEEINRELALREERLDQQGRYVSELEDKNRELTLQAERLEEELNRLSDLEDTNLELSIRTERFEEHLKDLEIMRDENRSLRSSVVELDASRKEIARLKTENAKLNSLGIVLKKPALQNVMPVSPDGLGGAFQTLVNRLSGDENSRGVVLADELGLLVAGTGEHTESMAAMAAIYATVSVRLESIFPFGEISQIVVENTDELTITMQPYDIASDKLILTSLSVGPGPTRESVVKLLDQKGAA